MKTLCVVGSLVGLGVAALPASATTILNLDMSENSGDFVTFHFDNNDTGAYPDVPDVDFSVSHGQGASGGNPGYYQYITNTMTPTGTTSVGQPLYMHTYTRYNAFSYTPSVSGVINTITFSIDVKSNVDAKTLFDVFIGEAEYSAGKIAVAQSDGYSTITATYAASDFSPGVLSGTSALRFGFGYETLTTNTGAAQSFTADFDNFVVSINEVPEPATLGVLAAGLLLLKRRRR